MNTLELLNLIKNAYPGYEWNVPPDLAMGILTTNQAFKQAKTEGRNPKDIAEDLARQIQTWAVEQNLPIQIKSVGPYVNIDINLENFLNAKSQNSTFEGWSQTGVNSRHEAQISILGPKSNQTLLLEYISPNVAKPLHAGHIRNANLGEALRRILGLKYDKIITDNHWADWGVQFGILLWAWKEFESRQSLELIMNNEPVIVDKNEYTKDPLQTLVKIYIWANQQKETVDNWDQLVRDEFLALEQGDKRSLALSREFVEISKTETRKDLDILGVGKFDYEYGESYYLKDVRELQEFLDKYQIWQSEDKARFFDFHHIADRFPGIDEKSRKQISSLGRCYLISSNGYSTYAFRDIAARINWARDFQADTMITVTGNEQMHHFKQFFAITAYLATLPEFKQKYGLDVCDRLTLQRLIHIAYGFLSLPEGKMSTRKGNIFTAKDLISQIKNEAKRVLVEKNYQAGNLDELSLKVGIAALKWFDLNRDSTADIVLNMDQILSFEGNTGVYQLYTLARLNSILEKNQYSLLEGWSQTGVDFNTTKLNSEELLIFKKTLVLPLILDQITQNYKPHLLCTHLFELATMINSWYAKPENSVSGQKDPIRKQTLLNFCTHLKEHIRFSLNLLAIESVEAL